MNRQQIDRLAQLTRQAQSFQPMTQWEQVEFFQLRQAQRDRLALLDGTAKALAGIGRALAVKGQRQHRPNRSRFLVQQAIDKLS